MTSRLQLKANDINQTIEFSLDGVPLFCLILLVSWSVYCVFTPSDFFILWHWRWSSALIAVVFTGQILQNASVSPFYKGPALALTAKEIVGRGGWGRSAWVVPWSEFDRAEGGRAVAVYTKGMKSWQQPLIQYGPFNAYPKTIVKCIEARAKALAASKQAAQAAIAQ